MNKTVFPIIEINQNRIKSIDGNSSYFYKLDNPDLEQMTFDERYRFYDAISSGLNHLNFNEYFKFYKIGRDSFLDTNSDTVPDFSEVIFKTQNDPLKIFFGERVLYSDIGIYNDYLSYNGQYIRIFSVVDFSEDEAYPFLLPNDLDYVIHIKRNPKDKSVSRLDRIRSNHLSSFLKSKRDITSEGAYNQAEELLSDIVHGSEELFDIEMFFILKATSVSELNNISQSLTIEMNSLGIKIFSEGQSLIKGKTGLSNIFNDLIPGVLPKSKMRVLTDKSSHLRFLLPLHESKLMKHGIEFHDSSSGEICFNPFDKNIKNRNMLVTGLSGGGKSVFVNKLIHHLVRKHPTVILDKGGSFRKLTEFHGGNFLDKGFNPLQFKDPLYIREVILSVVDSNRFDKLAKGRLLKEIKKNISQCDTFLGLISLLKNEFLDIDLYFEELKEYINDDVLEFKKIVYIDVEAYPKGIVAPLIIYILEYFKHIEVHEKVLVFDECWSFLKDHTLYIDECFRTFRKSGSFPIAISQSLNDFASLDVKLANSITNNCYFKVFFPQELKAQNDIVEFDINNIMSLRFKKNVYSECYLKTSDNLYRKTIKNYLTPLELQLFHTEAGKDLKYYSFLEKFGEFFETKKDAINAYVRLINEKVNNPFYISNEYD